MAAEKPEYALQSRRQLIFHCLIIDRFKILLAVHIRHLREKLETEPGAPRFLRTVRGIGYKLTKEEEP